MNTGISQDQIKSYRDNGFLVVDDFLNSEELEIWREAVTEAVTERNGRKMPSKSTRTGEDDGINEDAQYFGKVFDQLLNLWQTNKKVKSLLLNEGIGKMVADLAGWEGTRVWHDQALIKKPWANPTSWHLDTPFWSFTDRSALSVWIALDDATLENGCLYFIPGSYQKTGFNNAGIGKNMDAIFDVYPELRDSSSVPATMKAGSCSFHNGLTIHGAGPNMTNGYRRAFTCAFMPDGATFNGTQNILSEAYVQSLSVGDRLNSEVQNPLIFKRY